MANEQMRMHGNILIFLGILLVIDSFYSIQSLFTGLQANFVNIGELLIGLVVGFYGFKAREKGN